MGANYTEMDEGWLLGVGNWLPCALNNIIIDHYKEFYSAKMQICLVTLKLVRKVANPNVGPLRYY